MGGVKRDTSGHRNLRQGCISEEQAVKIRGIVSCDNGSGLLDVVAAIGGSEILKLPGEGPDHTQQRLVGRGEQNETERNKWERFSNILWWEGDNTQISGTCFKGLV